MIEVGQFIQTAKPHSGEWQKEMAVAGVAMANDNVGRVIFVYGTFVGDDPFGMNQFLSDFTEKDLGGTTKHLIDGLTKDLGNFTNDYVEKFEHAIGQDILCNRFDWSSRNNHIGRIKAAVKLCTRLAQNFDKNKKTLLIGHSHAGQVFALVTTLLEQKDQAKDLLEVIADLTETTGLSIQDIQNIDKTLEIIANIRLDIVTFGMPVRYHWARSSGSQQYKLLCIINHRNDLLPSSVFGILYTKDGDYVQKYAKNITDLTTTNNKEREINDRLNKVLETKNPLATFQDRQEPADYDNNPASNTVLIDYQDKGFLLLPNFPKTIFGHGTYTKEENMLFNTNLIVSHFYS